MQTPPMPVNNTEIQHAELVRRLFKRMPTHTLSVLHAAVGISGEAGELLDAVKKHWAYEQPANIANLIEEMGDLEFYMEALRKLYGFRRDQILQANIDKLNRRYHSGIYTNDQAATRADKQPDPGQS